MTYFEDDDIYENVDTLIGCLSGYATLTKAYVDLCSDYNPSHGTEEILNNCDYYDVTIDNGTTKNGSAFPFITVQNLPLFRY